MYNIDVIIIYGLAILYPVFLTKLIRKKISINDKNNISEIFKNIVTIVLISIGTILISTPILEMYDKSLPNTSSLVCHSSGGWNHVCTGNNTTALIYFIILGIIFIIHSIVCTKYIFKIFSNSKKVIPYIFMYLYIAALYACQIFLALYLYGLFTTINYSILVNILRLIVVTIPSVFYLISIHIVKNKQ